MKEEYENLDEVIEEMELMESGNSEYSIMKGLVYDTLRYERELEPEKAANISRLLDSECYEEARNNLEEILGDSEVEFE